MKPIAAPPIAPGLELRDLLTIDVAAELRKLGQAQLQGPWQLPAELVRRAIRSGATDISVDVGREIVVSDDGPGLDPALVHQIAILIDRRRGRDERHRAFSALERAGELSLMALLAVDHLRELRIDTILRGQRCQLVFREATGAHIQVEQAGAAVGPDGVRIGVRARTIDRHQAVSWLTQVARFAPVPVVVDGTPIRDGLSDSLIQTPLASPLQGRVALVTGDDGASAFLLAHGLVTAHVSLPESPGFQAVVELGTPDGDISPARLREALTPLLPELVDQAVALIADKMSRPRSWAEPHRAQLARFTLQAARCHLRPGQVERVPVFRTTAAGGPSLIDLATIRQLGEAGALMALSPDQRVDRYVLGAEPVLVADGPERSLLADVLGVRFRTPNLRAPSNSAGALARRLLLQTRQLLANASDWLRHPLRRPALADDSLTPAERAFVMGLRDHLRQQPGNHHQGQPDRDRPGVFLCAGSGPVRRRSGRQPQLLLPRDSQTVKACVRAFHADPQWLRAIHLALLGRER